MSRFLSGEWKLPRSGKEVSSEIELKLELDYHGWMSCKHDRTWQTICVSQRCLDKDWDHVHNTRAVGRENEATST